MNPPSTSPTPAHTAPATKTVLILEDDQAIRDTIVDMLEIMGFEHISAVGTLKEARLLVEHVAYDLYVSDCNLGEAEGGENGRHFLEEIRKLAPTGARLFISGDERNFAGFEGETLAKPFMARQFIMAINRAMVRVGREPFSI
jgi:DNA-binding response OmpR family regulator